MIKKNGKFLPITRAPKFILTRLKNLSNLLQIIGVKMFTILLRIGFKKPYGDEMQINKIECINHVSKSWKKIAIYEKSSSR